LGVYAYYDGRWGEAVELYQQSREARIKTGDPTNAAMADANIAEILADQGHLDEAEELLREVSAAWQAAGDAWGVAYTTLLLGVVAARDSRSDEAASLLAQARGDFAAIGASSDVRATDLAIAEHLVLAGRGAEALCQLALFDVHGADELGPLGPAIHRLRGLALLLTGGDGADEELRAAIAVAREQGANHQLAMALEAVARRAGGPSTAGLDGPSEHEDLYVRLGVVRRPPWPLAPVAPVAPVS
jgi:tetratricopeptide (TPR) repeat protein